MRKGQPGTWWVIKRHDAPFYWTGEWVETSINGEAAILPVHSLERSSAAQFATRDEAKDTHTVFGLPVEFVSAEMWFPQP